KQHIANIEPGFDPRTLKFTDVLCHFEGAQKEFVPNFLDGDNYLQFFGERDQRANLFLRTHPGITIGSLGIHHGRDQQHGIAAPQLGVTQGSARSEEHTSELQSPCNLVCRLLLEKKKTLPPLMPTVFAVLVPRLIKAFEVLASVYVLIGGGFGFSSQTQVPYVLPACFAPVRLSTA